MKIGADMDYFDTRRRFSATVRDIKAGYKKRDKDDDTRVKSLKIGFMIPVNKEMMDHIAAPIADLMNYGASEEHKEFAVNKLEISKVFLATVDIFQSGAFNPAARPAIRKGFDNLDEAHFGIKKFVPEDKKWFIYAQLECMYTEDLWVWLGKNYIESECVLETTPFQKQLFEQGQEKAVANA